jgi:hypothetical protein
MEDICAVRGQDVTKLSRDELEVLWKEAKSQEG